MIKTLFFDAAGTLIHVAEPVGQTYRRILAAHGMDANASDLEQGFRTTWKLHPPPSYERGERSADDDKSWWKSLFLNAVSSVFPDTQNPKSVHAAFEDAYTHYASPAAWCPYPEVPAVLEALSTRLPLWIVSNFDRRLISVLEGLGLARHFRGIILSSEVGASKPDRRMFDAALRAAGAVSHECLHVGDEEVADAQGARTAGIGCFLLKRPDIDLRGLVTKLDL